MSGTIRWLAVAGALAVAAPSTAQERYTVGGSDVAIYNLAGEITVTGSRDGEVTVAVTRGGSDAGQLDVQVGEIGGRQTLRVMYPSDRVMYGEGRWGGSTTLRVASDGTWGGDRSRWGNRGDQVRISNRGGGLDAHANLHITVPDGQRAAIYLAIGRITASNVNGRLVLDTHAGGVEARSMSGQLGIDTGSGSVEVAGMDGDLAIDTGSGSVIVSDVTGEDVGIDTGSGSVDASGIAARRINIDTGSGGIDLARSSARDIRLDTGTGSVTADLTTDIDRLVIDTGSGRVTVRLPADLGARLAIETGSGGIETDFPVMVTRRARGELYGEIGDGRGTIEIDTGSGGVRLLRK